jgi:flagellar hook-associated protein 3 FlgL
MPLSNVSFGRTTNALQARRLLANVSRDQTQIARLQQQISSGNRLQLASDDPVAAIQIFALQNALARQASYQDNIDTNQGYLSLTDQALGTVGDALNRAKAVAQAGIGDSVSDDDRRALIDEAASLLRSVVNAGNSQYQGRYIFGGSFGTTAPFSSLGSSVRYNGDAVALETFADRNLFVANNVDGQSAFAGFTTPVATRDLNPALTLNSKLADLHGGAGISLGDISVTVANGGPAITKTVDLTGAETLQDVKTRIENAFAAESITVAVAIDPGSQSGLRLTPSAGTIAVANGPTNRTASQLGIASAAAANIVGSNLDPQLTLFTAVASLNLGTGIGATAGTGLRIVNGERTSLVDLDGAATVEDVLNRIRAADPDVVAEIAPDGTGLHVYSRLNGADFSIGENNGQNATNLGLRTFGSTTLLSQLNYGLGVGLDQGTTFDIQRRNGSTTTINLAGSATVQDVLDRINAADPGILTASLNPVGNGISLTDASGAGVLVVQDNELARRLGIAGSAAGVLTGTDVNPQQPPGALNLIAALKRALENGDNQALNRLMPAIDAEVIRVEKWVRGNNCSTPSPRNSRTAKSPIRNLCPKSPTSIWRRRSASSCNSSRPCRRRCRSRRS